MYTFFKHTRARTHRKGQVKKKKKVSDAFVSARKFTISGQHNTTTYTY